MIDEILSSLPSLRSVVVDLLRKYHTDLIRFNRTQNLISRQDPERRAAMLIGESCLAAHSQNIKENEYVLDLGSGGGIPGIPTALCVEGLRVVLLERRASRCVFLRREVRALGLDTVEVAECDASPPGERAGRFDRVLLKAVATPPEALGLARPFLGAGGRAVLYREARWDPGEAGEGWRLAARETLSAAWLDREAAIFEFVPL